jgi:hypothetical protein
VIFLGPVSRSRENVPKRDTFTLAATSGAYYYLDYQPPAVWGAAQNVYTPPTPARAIGSGGEYPQNRLPIGIGPPIILPDTIQHLMHQVSGRTLAFSTRKSSNRRSHELSLGCIEAPARKFSVVEHRPESFVRRDVWRLYLCTRCPRAV